MIWIKTSSKELYSINSHMDTTSPMENTLVDNSRQQIILRFEWGKYKEAQFVKMLNAVYDKVVFWRKNIFLIPSGKSGKQYIEEKTRLPSKHINVRSTLKQRWLSTFTNAVSTLIFGWYSVEPTYIYRRCFNVEMKLSFPR